MPNMIKFLVLTLIVAITALPTPENDCPVPPKDQEFGLMMVVDDTYVSLNAVSIGNNTDKILVGQRLAAYPGTPAYLNGTANATSGPSQALNLDIDGQSWGLIVADVGDNYGISVPVGAVQGYQEFEFSAADGQIFHKLYAGSNLWLACERDVNGETLAVLSFGVYYSNGSAPAGCTATSVLQNCNVPGSTAVC